MTPPKRARPSFGDFQATPEPENETLHRPSLADLPVEAVVERILEHYQRLRDLRPITRGQKAKVLRYVLADFEVRGKHLASATAQDVSDYRAYLHHLTQAPKGEGGVTSNYAAHVVKQWNSVMRLVFGDTSKPGNGLIMRGFKETPRDVEIFTEEEHEAMLEAIPHANFRSPEYAEILETYIEVAWCAGNRCGSLLTEKTIVSYIQWADSTLVLGHIKTSDGTHTVVLTDRAVRTLRRRVRTLNASPAWRGPETPIFMAPDGTIPTGKWLNEALKRVAAIAGIRKRTTSHVFRATAGTLIGRENPMLAMQQLNVSPEVFNRHYNKPRLEDRLHRRDLLPGGDGVRQSPMEKLGTAHWRYDHGLIDKAELDRVRELTRLEVTQETMPKPEESAYA